MKQKYILETYDIILKEIKNPKILFDNDFVSFLENCCDESYLIYKINFAKQNGEINYIFKKPLHNLHPKVNEKNCIECDSVPGFEAYITEIVNELELNQHNIEFRWYSKNDNISLHILQNIDIKNLSTEHRFFLYCYHSLKNENDKIKKINKEKIFNFKSKERVEQYIHKKQ